MLPLCAVFAACGLPRDPEGTLERARGGVLRVGGVDAPPHLVREGAAASGPEAELVYAFARSLGAEVEWHWGALDDHMRALERFELALVAGGLTQASPWKSRVGFTRPWRGDRDVARVLAVPPGENGLLVALEHVIEERRGGGP
ncbi:MAG TPA: hypothetical protein VFQ22_02995 [Longimicrobiales bacterium]|nr:hypothetical protein [Longimicrobiales bacterium]